MLVFSSDGQTLGSSSRDKTAKLWQLDGTELLTIASHSDAITSLIFHLDGCTVATTSGGGSTTISKLDGTAIATLHECCCPEISILTRGSDGKWSGTAARRRKYVSLAFSPDGQILADTVTCNNNKNVRLWNLGLDDLLDRGCDWLRDYLQNNPNVSDRDKQLCNGIGTQNL